MLLRLQDRTGEGVAGQFVLFDHVASGIAAGSVLGYSSRSDTAVQFAIVYPGFEQVHCDLDTELLMNFLGRMRNVAPDGTDIEWLQSLIGKTSPNSIASAGMVPTFKGTQPK